MNSYADAIDWHEDQARLCDRAIEDTIEFIVHEESKPEPNTRLLMEFEQRLENWRDEKREHEKAIFDTKYFLEADHINDVKRYFESTVGV